MPDLRPLFDILAPLLGREHQKWFITRFAAEALSFLLRKTREEPLRLIIRHVFEDLIQVVENPGAKDYKQGLMTMFMEACVVSLLFRYYVELLLFGWQYLIIITTECGSHRPFERTTDPQNPPRYLPRALRYLRPLLQCLRRRACSVNAPYNS